MNALDQLDRLRREAVERARAEVLEARAAREQCQLARDAARRVEHDAERSLASARRSFADASTVLDLRAAEAELGRRGVELARAREAVTACERTHADAQAACERCERALVDAELGRRAVERKLNQRAADVGRRTEQKREDEAEDAFRTKRVR